MTTQEWLKQVRPSQVATTVRPHMKFKDGTTLSVQAGHFAYSTPRVNDAEVYTHVEVWRWPASPENAEFFHGHADYSDDEPAAYVPVEKVDEYAERHGGIVL